MFKRIDHVALHVADVDATAEFYTAVFGFEKYSEHRSGAGGGNIIYIRLADSVIELTTRTGGEPMSGFHLCFEPEDFDAAYAALTSRRLRIVTDVRATTPRRPSERGWRRAVFRGPNDESLEIRGGGAF